jgi:hypothetical protein
MVLSRFVTRQRARRAGGALQALLLGFNVLLAGPLHPCCCDPGRVRGADVGPEIHGHGHDETPGHDHHRLTHGPDGDCGGVPADDDAHTGTGCGCLDHCRAAPHLALPEVPALTLRIAILAGPSITPASAVVRAAAAPYFLPFANGPPPILA